MKAKLQWLKSALFIRHEHKLTTEQSKRIDFLNHYSLLVHMILSCLLVFLVEWVSRRSFRSAVLFASSRTIPFLYNSFIVFASLAPIYLFRRRAFARLMICSLWLLLGIINGCILSNRVTPFGYTDLKCVGDLLTMTNTNYFTATQVILVVIGFVLFLLFCVVFYIKGPQFAGQRHKIIAPCAIALLLFVGLPVTTHAAQNSNVIASYFSNIAQGYENYGFIYGFSSSVVGRGMKKPENYSEERIDKLLSDVEADKKTTSSKNPNIILILLESFCDPDEINFLNCNKDAIPTFHYLEKNFSTGYLTVPVVGAGTANSEFELLTGMSLQYFGTGEYPYKTILKKTDCESIASDLSAIGYGTHVVHNNGGNFYSRVNAFSMMGFDTFTSKELMGLNEYTPNGAWSTDDILVGETIKTLDATENQPDFTYTITVGSHGDYPKEAVIDNPAITITGVEDEGMANSWTYYVNQLNEVDTFLADLIAELEQRDEETIVVAFGDHLPTMGLTDEDMRSGDIYKTKYVTWNNFGLEKEDTDLYAYQLMAHITDAIGIHEGTIMNYHQTQSSKADYNEGLEELQYDILYGSRYCYDGEDRYPASDIVMGIDEVVIDHLNPIGNVVYVNGSNFTQWSRVYVNGKKVSTQYINRKLISFSSDDISDGDEVTVCQLGSSNTIFRSSNTITYEALENATELLESAFDTDDLIVGISNLTK